MKAITVDTHWGMPIALGEKRCEVRSWDTDYRGDLLIVTSNQKWPFSISGHALCVATLYDTRPMKRRYFKQACLEAMPAPPAYAWFLDDIRWIVPFKQKQQIRLFDVDDSKIHYIPNDMKSSEALRTYYEPLLCWSNNKIDEVEVHRWWSGLLYTYEKMRD